MAITAPSVKINSLTKFRWIWQEVDEFLDIIVNDLWRFSLDVLFARVRAWEKLAYFEWNEKSVSQSVILAQKQQKKLKKLQRLWQSANLINKANFNAAHLIEELNLRHLKFFVMQQMKQTLFAIETGKGKKAFKIVSSTNAYWLQLKVM